MKRFLTVLGFSALSSLLFSAAVAIAADAPEFTLVIKNHVFVPAELTIPAGMKVKLIVDNQDATAEEFESYELNREKVIPGNSRAKILVGPLEAGVYPFFGEFYAATAQGKLIVK